MHGIQIFTNKNFTTLNFFGGKFNFFKIIETVEKFFFDLNKSLSKQIVNRNYLKLEIMEDNLIDEFKPEIREALFDVAEDVLQTKDCKIRIEPGSKKGNIFVTFDLSFQFFLSRFFFQVTIFLALCIVQRAVLKMKVIQPVYL